MELRIYSSISAIARNRDGITEAKMLPVWSKFLDFSRQTTLIIWLQNYVYHSSKKGRIHKNNFEVIGNLSSEHRLKVCLPGKRGGCFHLSVKGYDYQTKTEHQRCGQGPTESKWGLINWAMSWYWEPGDSVSN